MQNRTYLNINAYAKDDALYVRLDITALVLEFEESNKAQDELNKICSMRDLKVVATNFKNEDLTEQDLAVKRVMPSKYIVKQLLEMIPKEPCNTNSFQGESSAKSIMLK